MKKKNISIFELVCYIAAAVMAVIGIYMISANLTMINEYLAAYGMSFMDMKGDVFQTVLPVFAQYFTYAFAAFGIGRIYHAVTVPKCVCEPAAPTVEEIFVEEPVAVIAEPAEAPVEPAEAPVEAEEVAEEAVEVVDAEVIGIAEDVAETVVEEVEPKEEN